MFSRNTCLDISDQLELDGVETELDLCSARITSALDFLQFLFAGTFP
jgi:hypothetical protein